MFFVAAGRPFKANARGFYALTADATIVVPSVLAANARMAELDSTVTAWFLFVTSTLRAEIDRLKNSMPASKK